MRTSAPVITAYVKQGNDSEALSASTPVHLSSQGLAGFLPSANQLNEKHGMCSAKYMASMNKAEEDDSNDLIVELENLLLSITIARLLYASEEMKARKGEDAFKSNTEKMSALLDFVYSNDNATFLESIFNISNSNDIVRSVEEKTKILMKRELGDLLQLDE